MGDTLLLIDGNSLVNRAYYAFGAGGGLSYNGAPTNATYGFLNMFLKSVADTGAKWVAVAFDVRAKTFRHKMYDQYKATRKGMPEELAVQLLDLKKLLGVMGVAIIEKEGFEADDIIGTIATERCRTIILSADRDGLQLVNSCTEVHLTKTGVTHLDVWDEARVRAEYGIEPLQLIDLKALMGDKSDNIPGASGVGEKTALGLMQQFGSLEKIYESVGEIKGALRERLCASRDIVFLSRELARIDVSVPIEYSIDSFGFEFPMGENVYREFDKRGFKSLCRRPGLWKGDFYSQGGEDTFASAVQEARVEGAREDLSEQIQIKTIEVKDLHEIEGITKGLVGSGGSGACDKYVAFYYDDSAVYIAVARDVQYRIPLCVDLIGGGFAFDEVMAAVKPILEGEFCKVVFDSKELKEKLFRYNISVNNVKVDVKICEHLLSTKTSFERPKGAADMLGTDYMAQLEAKGMLSLYRDIELPLVDVLIEMQRAGIKIDMVALAKASDRLQATITELCKQIYKCAGVTFNINSPQQLGDVLFNKLGIESRMKTKTGLSTNEAVLHKIAKQHEIVPLVLKYRKIFKLYSTYIQGYRNQVGEDAIVHSSFNNTATVTGRLSSSEPNIQNIPARSEDAEMVRSLFVSRFAGGRVVAADYSQIELRLLAHFSADETMIGAFGAGRDIHTETAVKIFGVDAAAVNSDMRRSAKAVNFGIVYGISAFGLSESMGCAVGEAARFIERYFEEFPKVKKFLDKCRDDAIARGFAVTLLGRRRLLPELSSSNHNTVQFGTRAAMNMPMQGSASDIIKKAMVEISREMKLQGFTALMVAQVHDELIFDCPAEEVERVCALVKRIMEGVASLSVPLVVDVEVKNTF